MRPKNEAFIDLEESLTKRLVNNFNKEINPVISKINKAVKKKDFDEAHSLADSITFEGAVNKTIKFATTIGWSSLLLGSSRVVDLDDSVIKKNKPDLILDNAINQLQMMLSRNGTLALQKQAHVLIDAEERRLEQGALITKDVTNFSQNFRVSIKAGAKSFNSIAASIHVSRLSSFGFLSEAATNNIEYYRVNEVMDARTCPVCQIMHGKIFPVSNGMDHAFNIMSIDDPDSLRFVAPWPRQDKESVGILGGLTNEELMEGGLSMPPYHPNCRGILEITTETVDIEPSGVFGNLLSDIGGAIASAGAKIKEIGSSILDRVGLSFLVSSGTALLGGSTEEDEE